MTTYDDMLAGFAERFATLSGLAAVFDYEPTTVGSTPIVYSLFDSYTVTSAGQLDKHLYRTMHRVVVAWADPRGAERALRPYLESLPAAVRADPRLGGRLVDGYATITGAVGVFVSIGNVLCRGYDFTSECFYKAGRQ